MEPPATRANSADALLDALRLHPEWTQAERERVFEQLVARFEPERLVEAIRPRLADLAGHDGEAVLRLADAFATPDLLQALAEAVQNQPALAADRAWEALNLLDEAGLLERYPRLVERWDELNEAIENSDWPGELVAQIDDDPDELWLPLQALSSIEPDVRAEIVAGLGTSTAGAGVIELLRLLTYAHDGPTRTVALEALARVPGDEPQRTQAWAKLAAHHPDPQVAARARDWLGSGADAALAACAGAGQAQPRIQHCLVTALDGRGEGSIVLVAEQGGKKSAAAFLCDVMRGVRDVVGQPGAAPSAGDGLLAELAGQANLDVVTDAPALALGLLAGSLLVCDAGAPLALPFWLERTAGPAFRPAPFEGLVRDWDPASLPREAWAESARAVLNSCPDWVDRSSATCELAEEINLRERGALADPIRDAPVYRYLFEHHLQHRLEMYRRMLFWMASFWHAAGNAALGRSALALAWQLSEPQHSVPGHPFLVELTTRSLAAAQQAAPAGRTQ